MKKTTEITYYPNWISGPNGYRERVREVFAKILDEENLRHTNQRDLILDRLLMAENHLSFEEIFKGLKEKGIGQATVFRMLKMLENHGIVDKIVTSQGESRYEIKVDRPHAHLICVNCGHIKEVLWPKAESIQLKVASKEGFHPIYHKNELFGRCQSCQPSSKSR